MTVTYLQAFDKGLCRVISELICLFCDNPIYGFVWQLQATIAQGDRRRGQKLVSCFFFWHYSSFKVKDYATPLNSRCKGSMCPSVCHCVSPSLCPCNPYPQSSAVASHRRLASLCMSLIPTACEVKCWQRITNHIRILKRPESAFMCKRVCVCICER